MALLFLFCEDCELGCVIEQRLELGHNWAKIIRPGLLMLHTAESLVKAVCCLGDRGSRIIDCTVQSDSVDFFRIQETLERGLGSQVVKAPSRPAPRQAHRISEPGLYCCCAPESVKDHLNFCLQMHRLVCVGAKTANGPDEVLLFANLRRKILASGVLKVVSAGSGMSATKSPND